MKHEEHDGGSKLIRWWIPILVVLSSIGVATAARAQTIAMPSGAGFSVGGLGAAGAGTSIMANRINVTPGNLSGGLNLSINNKLYQTPSVKIQTAPPVAISPTTDRRMLRTRIGDNDERMATSVTISRPASAGGPPPGGHGGETPEIHAHIPHDNGEDNCYYYSSDRHWHCYKVGK
jgi:hypothetical protein